MSEQAWDNELVTTNLLLLVDILENTDRIVELLERADGEKDEED